MNTMSYSTPALYRRVSRVALIVASASTVGVADRPAFAQTSAPAGGFTIEQITSYPYPSELTVAPTGSRLAWVFNERGVRNIYAAEGPDFQPHKLTSYTGDDGQELTNLSISADGKWVVYVRGGDHDANWAAEGGLAPDPTSSPVQPRVEIFAVLF